MSTFFLSMGILFSFKVLVTNGKILLGVVECGSAVEKSYKVEDVLACFVSKFIHL